MFITSNQLSMVFKMRSLTPSAFVCMSLTLYLCLSTLTLYPRYFVCHCADLQVSSRFWKHSGSLGLQAKEFLSREAELAARRLPEASHVIKGGVYLRLGPKGLWDSMCRYDCGIRQRLRESTAGLSHTLGLQISLSSPCVTPTYELCSLSPFSKYLVWSTCLQLLFYAWIHIDV